jgi:AAA family ATP:ADP antiporter
MSAGTVLPMRDALRRAFPLQRQDFPRGLLLVAYLFLVISAYLVGQVARDALFLGRFPAELLPYVDISSFLLVAVVVAVYIRAGSRAGLRRVLRGSLLLFAAAGLAFAAIARGASPGWLFPVVYVWVGVFGVLAPAQVWTLANYVLTPREAKRLFGLVGSGATMGAIAGGFLSTVVARRYGAESLLVLMAGLLLGASVLVEALWRRRPEGLAEAASPGPPLASPRGLKASLRLVAGSPYLQAVAGVIAMSSLVTALCGWQLKAMAQEALVRKDALAEFFGSFNGTVGVGCLAVQVLLTGGILRRFRLGWVLFLLPVGLLAGSLGLLVVGSLAAAVALKGIDKVLRYSIDRPAVELLYLPVPAAEKLPAKSFIDTVVWRAGDGAAGLAVLVFATVGGMGPVELSWVTVPLIALWLLVAAQAYRRYVRTLEESLQKHRLDLERAAAPALDRATTEILAARLDVVDPREILYALDAMSVSAQQATHPAVRGLLAHPAEAVRRRALELLGAAGDRSAIPQAEALLEDPSLEVRTEALLYLARHADVDPLVRVRDLAEFSGPAVRAAVVAVLARLGGDRLETARALFEALAGEADPEGRTARLEAARLAERLPVAFADPLRRLIEDADPAVAGAAIRAAARHGAGPFADLLVARLGEPSLRDAAAEALAKAGSSAMAPLGGALADPKVPPEVRHAVPGVLERIGSDEAAAVLVEHLLQGDGVLRLRTLQALGRMRDERPALALDPHGVEAVLGAEILGHYRSYQILGALRALGPRPPAPDGEPLDHGLRTAMTDELQRIFLLLDLLQPRGDFRSAWVALRSGDPVLHDHALELLESLLPASMRSLVVPLIDPAVSEAERVRRATRLGERPVETPVEAVEALLGTGDPWLRACGAYSIGVLGLHALRGRLDEWRHDPDPLLRETVRQARARLAARPDA